MKKIGIFPFFYLITAIVIFTFIYQFKLEMLTIQSGFNSSLTAMSNIDDGFKEFLKSAFSPYGYINTLNIMFSLITVISIILFLGIIKKYKYVNIGVLTLGVIGTLLFSFDHYKAETAFSENKMSLNNFYNEYKSELPDFENQLYKEAISRYENYSKQPTLENKVKANMAFTVSVSGKDLLKRMKPEEIKAFQEGMISDVKFSVLNEKTHQGISFYVFLMFVIFPLFALIKNNATFIRK